MILRYWHNCQLYNYVLIITDMLGPWSNKVKFFFINCMVILDGLWLFKPLLFQSLFSYLILMAYSSYIPSSCSRSDQTRGGRGRGDWGRGRGRGGKERGRGRGKEFVQEKGVWSDGEYCQCLTSALCNTQLVIVLWLQLDILVSDKYTLFHPCSRSPEMPIYFQLI